MVIGERFAWAHLPKTGGDTTRALFCLFPGLVHHADPSDTNDKHATFSERSEAVAGKTLAMNFRRLPAWVLSRAHHVAREGLWPDYRPQPIRSARALAESSLPDERLLHFTSSAEFTTVTFAGGSRTRSCRPCTRPIRRGPRWSASSTATWAESAAAAGAVAWRGYM
jgi:hypothetical protein